MPTVRAKPKDHEDHATPPTGRWLHAAPVFEVLDVIPQEHSFDPKTGEKLPDVLGVVGVIEVSDPTLLGKLGIKVE